MATAQAWEAGMPPEVLRLIGFDAEIQLAIAEHKVDLPGRGGAAQCDVFALAHAEGRDMAVAVEAKVSEPFDKTLADWNADHSSNKALRLTSICDWLGIDAPSPDLRYQLISRTAAAIAEARRFRRPVAVMIVQSFSPTRAWFPDFEQFLSALSIKDVVPDQAYDATLPDGMALRLGWATGDPQFLKELN